MKKILKTQDKLYKYISIFMMILIIIQPILDVLSYWLIKSNNTSITTGLRILMLGIIIVYSFIITKNKRVYYFFYGIIGIYWLSHMLNCFRIGYINPISDISLFIRVVQMPILTLSFITFIKNNNNTKESIYKGSFIALLIVISVIILSYLTGTPDYMYYEVGVKGWFHTGNAQSIIVTVLVSLSLLFAYKVNNNYLFIATSLLGFGLLFLSGTRVTYFSIFIIAIGLTIMLIINKEKNIQKYLILILTVLVCGGLFSKSPMLEEKEKMYDKYNQTQEKINENINKEAIHEKDNTNENNHQYYEMEYGKDKVIPNRPYTLNEYKKIYEPYMWLFEDAVNQYGFEEVFEEYNYTTDAVTLANNRLLKRTIAKIEWRKQDFITKLFGYENDKLILNGNVYIPENDFQNIIYFNGYIGVALYMLFILYFAILIIIAIIKNFKNAFTVETGLIGTAIILMLGSAQLSGQVVQRPNVSIYLSVLLAIIYSIAVFENGVNPYVGIKKYYK